MYFLFISFIILIAIGVYSMTKGKQKQKIDFSKIIIGDEIYYHYSWWSVQKINQQYRYVLAKNFDGLVMCISFNDIIALRNYIND